MGNLPPDYYPSVVESVMFLFDLKNNQKDQTKGSQRVETRTEILVNNGSYLQVKTVKTKRNGTRVKC
jgi:hypothetical protein